MKLPRYPSYKPSGVEWLGDVPEHWPVKRLRRLARLQSGESITSDEMQDGGDYAVFGGNGHRGFTTKFTHRGHYVLIGRQGALCGNVNYATGKFWASEHAVVVSPLTKWSTVWMGELLYAMNLNQYSQSAAQPGLSVDRILSLLIPVPPCDEQESIANFLDRETAKIDTLVAKKRTLIERLKEKRTALISRAVTRGLLPDAARAAGLDPNPKLKPSGIDWLGEVPEHWEVKRFRYLLRRLDQGWSPIAASWPASEGEWGVLKLSAAREGRFLPSENKALEDDLDDVATVTPRAGDLLISRSNTPDRVGDAGFVLEDHPRLLIPDLLYRVQLRDAAAEPAFVCLFLLSKGSRAQIEADARGSSGSMVKLGQSHVRAWSIPCPPQAEQRAISDFLIRETTKIDHMVAKIKTAIERLQEYRIALITAAVTGKIDVRRRTVDNALEPASVS